jgi:hypothetical protein
MPWPSDGKWVPMRKGFFRSSRMITIYTQWFISGEDSTNSYSWSLEISRDYFLSWLWFRPMTRGRSDWPCSSKWFSSSNVIHRPTSPWLTGGRKSFLRNVIPARFWTDSARRLGQWCKLHVVHIQAFPSAVCSLGPVVQSPCKSYTLLSGHSDGRLALPSVWFHLCDRFSKIPMELHEPVVSQLPSLKTSWSSHREANAVLFAIRSCTEQSAQIAGTLWWGLPVSWRIREIKARLGGSTEEVRCENVRPRPCTRVERLGMMVTRMHWSIEQNLPSRRWLFGSQNQKA